MPSRISGLQLWLKADSIAGLNDGDALTTWVDQSGVGNNVTQATTANKPLYKTNIVNSLPVVRFDGSNDFMSVATPVITGGAYSMFIVFKSTITAARINPFYVGSNSGVDGYGFEIDIGGLRNIIHRGIAFLVGGSATTNFEIWAAIRTTTGPLAALYINGTDDSVTNGTSAIVTPTAITVVGAIDNLATNPLPGDISEIIVYDSALSDANRDSIETYLGTKYNITVA